MTDAAERVGSWRWRRATTDVRPRQPSRRRPLPGPAPEGRLHAVNDKGLELLIFGDIGGTTFYRAFRPGSAALPGPAGTHPAGTILGFSGSFVRIANPTTGEVHRLDLYQFIRLNWDHDRQPAESAQ